MKRPHRRDQKYAEAVQKLERLMNLMAALLEAPRPLSAEELRQRVGGYPEEKASFRRAFERDKDDLREMGIPLSVETVPGVDPPVDGYRIHKADYYLRDPELEPDELAALHLAATAIRFDGVSEAAALRKLGGVVGDEGMAGPELAALPSDPRLPVLFGALAERRRCRFRYGDTDREVEPHRLDFRRGRWYLTGFDLVRGADRNYRVDRIVGIVEAGEAGAYDRPATVRGDVQPWEMGDDEPTTARLLIDADQAGWALHHLGDEGVVEQRPDGSLVLEVNVTDEAAFRSFVLTFLEHAEVLAPPELRAGMIRWLEAMVP